MGILISRRGVLEVTNFADLRAAYSKYRAARDVYWDDLEEKVKILVDGFSQYVAPDRPFFIDRDGTKKPYIQIGKAYGATFEPVRNASQLDEEGMGLQFTLAVYIDEDPDSLPKEGFTVDVNMRKAEGKYQFKLRTSAGSRAVNIPASFGETERADLYEAILGEIMRLLSPEKFG